MSRDRYRSRIYETYTSTRPTGLVPDSLQDLVPGVRILRG